MLQHDYDSLNDAQCLHVDHFTEKLDLWRRRNLGEATAFRAARADAQRRFPLEDEEIAVMDSYIESRFGAPKITRKQGGVPMPMMVVS